MKWKVRRQSTNVEDRRGMGGRTLVGGGIGGIVVVLIVMLFGGNPGDLLNSMTDDSSNQSAPYEQTGEEKELASFVSVVLADTEDVWTKEFKKEGKEYKKPKLVLYNDSVQSACGTAGSSVGPFYCPGDQKLYIDLSFYQELQNEFKAPGDFAMAYVIAHEVGHHVQNLLGTMDQNSRQHLSKKQANAQSVQVELQADYFAGVWAHHAQGMDLLEKGDLEEAVTAASAVGDDTLQKKAQGYAVPDSFTHGSSEQRMRWFKKGFNNGRIEGGDTFHAKDL
ncbi:KPN_02809 family neutral zinc metallopeptidase [Fictibacillus terranigra]|uniref:Neutral zinc metallopeptidase n=1 Tax=Fictibacillus terranigra TaxID=3058424 RepID=A0ABT8EAW5_9BACL|nr:neutral zinc metallopeptidase [Fictibacillus sp. CENA-BCM004]MDN4075036.1 neutral zinc metallopeptidase [Fictibacillus sp. CENA-BCM004]